jgi:hypothetical protein
MTHKQATALAGESSCLVCGTTPCSPCHWPRHRGSGGRFENEWDPENWIPACRKCHDKMDARNGASLGCQEQTKIVRYIVSVKGPAWQRAHS